MGESFWNMAIQIGLSARAEYQGLIAADPSDGKEELLQQPTSPSPYRVVISDVYPQIEAGRYPVKRIVGDLFEVQANIFADGHETIGALLQWRRTDQPWQEVGMNPLGNDRWQAVIRLSEVGRLEYRIMGWVDPMQTWRHKVEALLEAGVAVTAVDWQEGIAYVMDVSHAVPSRVTSRALREWTDRYAEPDNLRVGLTELDKLMDSIAVPHVPTLYPQTSEGLPLWVDPVDAQYTAWYELFPRSAGTVPGVHGTFADVQNRLPYIAGMGFDVVYLPPIHPIGKSFRKGRHNSKTAQPGEPGSPWAIGGAEGGHTAIHPDLGSLQDFDQLVDRAHQEGLEIALDLAFQCSPDHPWVHEHPEWFRARPDGSIHYAENPPKKYEDIFPFDFESNAWPSLWDALHGVVEFWISHGVRFFRVDNPHTKSLYFWEWLIDKIKRSHPQVVFLAEAFTRPAVMQHLAKVGFSQSYTYFTWRNTSWELRQYMEELASVPMVDFFRPSFWPNTPDILPHVLQSGVRAAYISRLVLAATLSASYGIYGPAFELMASEAAGVPSEEYGDSEKYRIAQWNWDASDSLAPIIKVVNQFRHHHLALWNNRSVRFHEVDNDQLLVYSKSTEDGLDRVLMVVNLDFRYRQSGFVTLPLTAWGFHSKEVFVVEDALTGARYEWQGARNYVELGPKLPAHLFHIIRTTS